MKIINVINKQRGGVFVRDDVSNYKLNYIDSLEFDEQPFIYYVSAACLNSYLGLQDANLNYHVSIPTENFLYNISEDIKELIRYKNGYIVVSYLQEGHVDLVSYKILHEELKKYNIPADKVFFIASNLNCQNQYDLFCKKYPSLTSKKMFVLGGKHMLESATDIYKSIISGNSLGDWDEMYPYKQSILMEKDIDELKDYIREKYFICYNRNPREYRVALATLLFEEWGINGLLDRAIYSLGSSKEFDSRMGGVYPTEFNGAYETWVTDVDFRERLVKKGKELQKYYPMQADGDINTVPIETHPGGVCQWSNFSEQYKRIYFGVVTESVFASESIYLSEKPFKVIAQLTPFIIVSTPFYMKKLRELGFKTFSPWIDESYDEEENHEKRMIMLSEEIKRLCTMSLEEIHKWYYEMKDILLYNQNVLLNFKKSDHIDLYSFIYEKINKDN